VWELVSDATLPFISWFSGKKFSHSIRYDFVSFLVFACSLPLSSFSFLLVVRFFARTILGEDVQIEDLWIKYFCVRYSLLLFCFVFVSFFPGSNFRFFFA
jgi:hypothetical protein